MPFPPRPPRVAAPSDAAVRQRCDRPPLASTRAAIAAGRGDERAQVQRRREREEVARVQHDAIARRSRVPRARAHHEHQRAQSSSDAPYTSVSVALTRRSPSCPAQSAAATPAAVRSRVARDEQRREQRRQRGRARRREEVDRDARGRATRAACATHVRDEDVERRSRRMRNAERLVAAMNSPASHQ